MERHNGIEPDPEGAFVYYTDAQAQLEAVRQERDEAASDRDDWITSWRVLQRHNERIEATLDAERETLQAERERSLKQAREAMVVLVRAQLAEQELATLKALVGEKGGDGE